MKQSDEIYEHLTELQERNDMLLEALKQIEARAVYMKVKDTTYADTHWEYIRQTCNTAIAQAEGRTT